jgi:hypothetical protein
VGVGVGDGFGVAFGVGFGFGVARILVGRIESLAAADVEAVAGPPTPMTEGTTASASAATASTAASAERRRRGARMPRAYPRRPNLRRTMVHPAASQWFR